MRQKYKARKGNYWQKIKKKVLKYKKKKKKKKKKQQNVERLKIVEHMVAGENVI